MRIDDPVVGHTGVAIQLKLVVTIDVDGTRADNFDAKIWRDFDRLRCEQETRFREEYKVRTANIVFAE